MTNLGPLASVSRRCGVGSGSFKKTRSSPAKVGQRMNEFTMNSPFRFLCVITETVVTFGESVLLANGNNRWEFFWICLQLLGRQPILPV